jgi:hypothetical protein
MFRDKNSIFTLTAGLLERIVVYDRDLMAICASQENVKRLRSIATVCSRRLLGNVAVNNQLPLRPPTRSQSRRGVTRSKAVKMHDPVQAVRSLEHILRSMSAE